MTCGVGSALRSSLAIDQIFCLAPSIRPLIDPVVSKTKHTSIRAGAGAGTTSHASRRPVVETSRSVHARVVNMVLFFVMMVVTVVTVMGKPLLGRVIIQ